MSHHRCETGDVGLSLNVGSKKTDKEKRRKEKVQEVARSYL